MVRARRMGLRTPVVYLVEHEAHTIYMEHIAGSSVKALLRAGELSPGELSGVMAKVGRALAVLHDGGLVHGDLTTSNMMLEAGTGELVLIDYGLAANTVIPEDKAVDLYVLERAFSSAHSEQAHLVRAMVSGRPVLAPHQPPSRPGSTHNFSFPM